MVDLGTVMVLGADEDRHVQRPMRGYLRGWKYCGNRWTGSGIRRLGCNTPCICTYDFYFVYRA